MKQALLLILVALALSSCNLSRNELPETDWCYIWDFRVSDQGFNQTAGNWVEGRGFVDDETGHLAIDLYNAFEVEPKTMIVTIARASAQVIPIHVEATVNIFGTQFGTAATDIPADVTRVELAQQIYSYGYIVEIDGHSSQTIQLESIELGGFDLNPFGADNCAPGRPVKDRLRSLPEIF